MTKPKRTFRSPKTLLDQMLGLAYFHPDEKGQVAIPFHRAHGKGNLIVITGDNASGKSFARRLINLLCRDNDIECMPISMEGRREISDSPWLVFVYGDEGHEATGVNSASTVLKGIETCQARTERHVIIWDEPDIGLSEEWAAGVGQKIREFSQTAERYTVACVVVSHSRALLRELIPAEPHYLHLGVDSSKAPQTLEAWVSREVKPRDPSKLREVSRKRFKAIQAIINYYKA